jgi:hypothetical protein
MRAAFPALRATVPKMTTEERSHMTYLCEKLATEKNGPTFDALVKELLELLERKHKRIHPEHKSMLA